MNGPTMPGGNGEDAQLPEVIQLSQDEVKALWQGVEDQLTLKQKQLRPKLHRLLEKRTTCAESQFLIGGQVELALLGGEMGELVSYLLDHITPMADAAAAVQLLNKLVDKGNSLGLFQLCPPPLVTLFKREPSPFFEKQIPMLAIAPALRRLIEQSLKEKESQLEPAVNTAKLAMGRLFISSVVHGGLLEYTLIDKLAQLLCQSTSLLQCLGERIYVEFSLDYRHQDDAEFRRWFIDPLTAALILQVTHEQALLALGNPFDASIVKEERQKCIAACIDEFIKSVSTAKMLPPRLRLPRIFEATRLDLKTRMPMMLVNYASRKIVSHSLRPHVWRRVHGALFDAHESSAHDEVSQLKRLAAIEGSAAPPEIGDQDDSGEIEPRWLGPLRKSLQGHFREGVALQVNQLKEQANTGFEKNEAGYCFADFALWLLYAQRDQQARFALPTVKDYVISVAKRLGGLMGAHTTDQLHALEWASMFEEVLADAHSKGMKSKLVRVLREFMRFLSSEKGVSQTEALDVLGPEGGLVPVDANWLTEREFQSVREQFVAKNANDLSEQLLTSGQKELRTISKLVLTLSYRCGLRRSEVLMLELVDALLGDPAELLIRPTASRTLKTPSATRKIPLHALLLDEELQELKAWVNQRNAQELKQPFSRHIFAIPSEQKPFLQEDKLFKHLHEVMRVVTGDPTLRFHHLRHTFASQIDLVLMLSQIRNPKQVNVRIPGLDLEIKHCQDLRQSLFGNQRMTRRDLWAVCFLLGHSGPDVSLEHYVHTLDLGLAWHLDQDGIAPSKAAVVAATGQNRISLYRHHQNDQANNLHSWLAHLWKKSQPAAPLKASKPNKKMIEPERATQSQRLHWLTKKGLEDLWNSLYLNQTKGLTPYVLVKGEKSQIPDMTRMIENARRLRDMTMSGVGSAYRHRFIDNPLSALDSQVTKRIACPIQPIKAHDQTCLEKLTPMFEKVLREEPSLSKSALRYFAENAHPKMAAIHFEDPQSPDDARSFLAWLEKMGLGRSDLRIESYDKITPRSQFRASWKAALNLHTSILGKAAPRIGRKDWACPWLGIAPVFDDGGSKKSTTAFRYLMLMAYIIRH